MPAALFAALSLAYFANVVFTDQIVLGSDSGNDLYEGVGLSLADKLRTLVQPQWDERMGGFPRAEEIRPQYFPLYALYFLTSSFQRYLSWRYVLTTFFAGWGMYCLVRRLGLGMRVATWAGVAYMSAPTFLAFTLAGHYAKMGVIALFPWMVATLLTGMNSGRPAHFALLGLTIGLGAYSPHPQMLYHALLALGLFFLCFAVDAYLRERDRRRLGVRAGLFAMAVAIGLAIGAEGIFPLYHHTRTQSKRAAVADVQATSADRMALARSWSLHPEEVGSLVVPEFGGFFDYAAGKDYYWGRNQFKLNSEYFGIITVLLALIGVTVPRRRHLALFLAGLFLVVLAYALGAHTPVHWLAFHLLPGAEVMRALGMVAFIFAFAAVVLASLGLESLLEASQDPSRARRLGRQLAITGGVLTGIALLVALAPRAVTGAWVRVLYSQITPEKQRILADGYGWLARGGLLVGLTVAAGTALLCAAVRGRVAATWVVIGLCLLTLADTWRIDRVFLRYEDPRRTADIREENRDVVQFLTQDGQRLRVFAVPDHRLLETPGYRLHGIPVVTGFHDFTIARYDRLLRELAPVVGWFQAKYYSGQQPPYSDAELLDSVAPLLNLLNARYVVAPRGAGIDSDRYPLVYRGARLQVHANPRALPFFYLRPAFRTAQDGEQALDLIVRRQVDLEREAILEEVPDFGLVASRPPSGAEAVEVVKYDLASGEVRLRANCPGERLLVFSHNFHPNWRAQVGGTPVPVLRANYLWQGVALPAGDHDVVLRCRSNTAAAARVVSLVGLLVAGAIGAVDAGIRRRGRRGVPTSRS